MTRTGWIPTAVLIVGLMLAPLPAQADAPAGPRQLSSVEGITEYSLSNGVRFLLYPDPAAAKVTVNMTVLVGSRHEGYGETGMAHLLEHMVFKGTPTHPDVPKALLDRGAQFNGTTWVDRTNYFETLNASDDNLEFALRLEADRLVNSYVKREDLISEMTVVRNEFESGENNPIAILSQRMHAAAYEWHNYGKSTIGNRSDIERVPIDRLQAFYRKYYQPDNVLVIVAGKFDEAKAKGYLVKYFGALKKPTRQLESTYTEEPAQDGERTVVLRRVGTAGVVGALYHVPAGAHADFPAIEVLSTLLSSEPTGRLYRALVLSKKATHRSAAADGWHDTGVLEIICEVDKANPLEAVRDALIEQVQMLATDKVTPEEVEQAKAKLAKNRELLMTDSNRIGVTLSDWAAKGDWRLFFLHRDRVAKVTPADVARVAGQYLQTSNRTVGLYFPSDKPARTEIPGTPDVAALLKDYKGGKSVAAGEFFDPTPQNIESRVQRSELPSGIKMALLPKKTRGESVVVELTLHYGNAESLKGNTSATQFLAPLMIRGTKEHSYQALEAELDRLKARLRPSGLLGDASFVVECKRENLPAVLALLHEVLREPTFPATEFETLRRQVRDGLDRGRTEPTALASRALQRKLSPYPPEDVRYTPTIDESIARLDAVTVEQVRKLYEQQLGGQSGELVVVGDFDPTVVKEAFTKMFDGWKAGTPYKRVERPAVAGIAGEEIVIDTPDKANAVYMAGMMLPIRDTDPANPALEVGNFLFGGGSLSSRLGNRVRQKEGLSYGVGSQYGADDLDARARLFFFAISNPSNTSKVDTAIREELDKFLASGVGEQELAEAKKAYLAQMKVRRTTEMQLAGMLREELYAGRTMAYYADLEKKVEALTVDAVADAFRRNVDPHKLVIIKAGDFKKKATP